MNTLIARTAISAAALGLTSAALSAPASASELDDEIIAASLCPGAEFVDVESAEYSDRAEVSLFVYGTLDAANELTELCSFAIISTDEDSTLNGSYSITAGSTAGAGAVSGSDSVTTAVKTAAAGDVPTSVAASGQQTTVEVDKATSAQKRAAKKKLDKAVKSAKKAYKKAGKTKKAKKAKTKRVLAAKQKYRAAVATKTTTTVRPYSLRVDLVIPSDAVDTTPDP